MREEGASLEKDVAGEYNTFRVYLLMLRVRKGAVRDIARKLGWSSPWLAKHHLEKLVGFGLVTKNEIGDYEVVRKRFGLLRLFTMIGRWIVPHTFFVSLIFLVMALGFLPRVSEDPLFTSAWGTLTSGLKGTVYHNTIYWSDLG
jgi:hypothetical protein